MVRAIRRQLRLIRYYSAPRRRDRVTVVFERAALISLVLCVPVAMLVDRTIHRATPAGLVEGRLVVDREGTYHASFTDLTSNDVDPIWYRGEPVAQFDLAFDNWHHGWPITTSRSRAPAQLSFTPFDQRAYSAASLAADPGVRAAVERAVNEARARHGAMALDATFSLSESRRTHSPMGWIYASFVWFVLLMALIIGPLLLLELAMRVRRAAWESRSSARRERGLCIACGYNLTGNEFSERCPECGTLV
jgi:hypothetical protein